MLGMSERCAGSVTVLEKVILAAHRSEMLNIILWGKIEDESF